MLQHYRADVNKIPFLAAYNFDDNPDNFMSSCTGKMSWQVDGNSEKGAQVRGYLCYLIWLSHLTRSRAVKNRILFLRRDGFSIMRMQDNLSNHLSTPWYKKHFFCNLCFILYSFIKFLF